MYIAPESLQELRRFVFEGALPNKCYPQVPLSLGQSKNTRLSRSSCFPIQLSCANMFSHNCRRMTKPGEDQLFLQAAPNTDTAINLPNNNLSTIHKKIKKKSRGCMIRFMECTYDDVKS